MKQPKIYVLSTDRVGKGIFVPADRSYALPVAVTRIKGRISYECTLNGHPQGIKRITANDCWVDLLEMLGACLQYVDKKQLKSLMKEFDIKL